MRGITTQLLYGIEVLMVVLTHTSWVEILYTHSHNCLTSSILQLVLLSVVQSCLEVVPSVIALECLLTQ